MEIFRGIERRMQIFEGFEEGKRLLAGRHMLVSRGRPDAGLTPCVFVLEDAAVSGRAAERLVRLFIWEDGSDGLALVYAAAEELEDYLSGILGFTRTGLSDGRTFSGRWLRLEYRRSAPIILSRKFFQQKTRGRR